MLPVFDKIFILPLDRNAPEQIYLCTNRYIFYVFSMTLKCMSEVICHLRHQDTCLLRQISTNTDTVATAGLGQSPCYVMKWFICVQSSTALARLLQSSCLFLHIGHGPYHICYACMIFIKYLLWSSGEGQARIGKGWQSRPKASKIKPEPRAYIKVGCHLPPTGSLNTLD